MSRAVRDLYEQASGLEANERTELAGLLLESLESEEVPRAGVEDAWAGEIERRMSDYQLVASRRFPGRSCALSFTDRIDDVEPRSGGILLLYGP